MCSTKYVHKREKNDNNNKEEETGEEKKRIIIKDSRAPQPTTENGRSPLLTFVIGGNRVSSWVYRSQEYKISVSLVRLALICLLN